MAILEVLTGDASAISPMAILAGVVAIILTYLTIFPVSLDPKEPPLLRPKVPFVGHIIGLIQHQWSYHKMHYSQVKRPIYTLPMLGGKMYVVTTPDLAQAVIRNRSLSFDPYVHDFIVRMTDVNEVGIKAYEDPVFFSAWLKIIYSSMTGQQLTQINVAALNSIATTLNQIQAGQDLHIPDINYWTKTVMTMAGTSALFGSMNPWRLDPGLVDAYWDYDQDLHKLMVNILPSITASKAFQGRARMQKAMTEYFTAKHDTAGDVPAFVKSRLELEREWGLDPYSSAALEVAVIHGALSNTIPTSYWFFTHIFSQPSLVARLREEALKITEETGSTVDGKRQVIVHINKVEDSCPLFMSCFRETQRFTSIGALNRRVLADTTISDGKNTYVLRKDMHLQVPHGILHQEETIWGADHEQFVGDRFLKVAANAGDSGAMTAIPGFLPFGGGKHICPGRYFASGEIIGAVILLMLGFDFTNASGEALKVPETTLPWLVGGILRPKAGSDLRATISRRPGWENVEWVVAG